MMQMFPMRDCKTASNLEKALVRTVVLFLDTQGYLCPGAMREAHREIIQSPESHQIANPLINSRFDIHRGIGISIDPHPFPLAGMARTG